MESPKGIMRGVTPAAGMAHEKIKTANMGRKTRNSRFRKIGNTMPSLKRNRFIETLSPLYSHRPYFALPLYKIQKSKASKLSNFFKNF
jgi:hypothetical protein